MILIICFALCCVTLRLLQGVGRPDEVLACVEVGVDLFEGFFPFQVTERGCALCFSFDVSSDPERAGSAPASGVVKNSFIRTHKSTTFEFICMTILSFNLVYKVRGVHSSL